MYSEEITELEVKQVLTELEIPVNPTIISRILDRIKDEDREIADLELIEIIKDEFELLEKNGVDGEFPDDESDGYVQWHDDCGEVEEDFSE